MELKLSEPFKKDLKRYEHDREKLRDLKRILVCLQATGAVPLAYNPHKLSWNMNDAMNVTFKMTSL